LSRVGLAQNADELHRRLQRTRRSRLRPQVLPRQGAAAAHGHHHRHPIRTRCLRGCGGDRVTALRGRLCDGPRRPQSARGRDGVPVDRKFSRDEERLRHMGITIATRSEHDAYGDAGETGYRISAADYAMDLVALTPTEVAAVTVAAAFWSETELGSSSAQAMTKLRALGIDLDETAGGQPTIDPGTAARRLASAKFADALHHINAREAIGFTYH